MKPETHYTKSGSINIAYQVFGSGSVDLVYIPGWISNIDLMWANAELVEFLLELGKTARVILFDKRGTGLSDRIVEFSTLEERMDDIRAVMDAVNSKRAILFGHSEGGSVSALFSATYPERTIALITFGIFAKRRYSQDYPWAPTDKERQVTYDMIENSWGSGDMNLESLAPSKANDAQFMEWLSNYFRSGASPSAAMVLTKMNTQVDIIDILGSINVPALIMQRTHDIDVKIEEGQFIAARIPNAKFVELEGKDHLFWVGDTSRILREMRSFLGTLRSNESYQESLYALAAGRFKFGQPKAELLSQIEEQLIADGGKNFYFADSTFFSSFERPTKAVHSCLALAGFLGNLGIEAPFAVDMRAGNTKTAPGVSEIDKEVVNEILDLAASNKVLVTQAVKYLLSGVDLHFELQGQFHLDVDRTLFLFEATDSDNLSEDIVKASFRDGSFLEEVLEVISANFNNDTFGVDELCREVGISERQLQRKLKAITNKSPIQLISSVKLHNAKKLLMTETYSISEVAYQSGFNNPSYFAKCFKKEFGMSPSTVQMGA